MLDPCTYPRFLRVGEFLRLSQRLVTIRPLMNPACQLAGFETLFLFV
jgi:hypothetical protein